jgi:hypothetical protein
MLFCQLGHAQSLREICGGLAATEGKLRHLGVALRSNPGHLARGPFCSTQIPDERRQVALKPRTELTSTSGDR